jgi:peroxiredoxin
MANLTGAYDVATEVSLGLVNCIVAAIHENEDEDYPRLPHSLTVVVDDSYRGAGDPVPEAQRTGIRIRAEVQASTPTISFPVSGLAEPIWSRSRAAVRTAVRPGRGAIGPLGPFRPGAGSSCWPSVSARVRLRAWLRDGPDALPEFLHGDLLLTAGLMRAEVAGATFLGFDYTSGPDISFEPAAGASLTAEQRALAERILGNFIRGDAEKVTFKLDLPQDVTRFDYALHAASLRPSAMLMFGLRDQPAAPAGAAAAPFLPAGADFAVGVGRDYLLRLFRTALLSGLPDEFSASGFGYSARVRPNWAAATFDLQPGRILFSVSGGGSTTYGGWGITVTDNWTFTIRLAFTLSVVAGVLRPSLAGDPQVELHDVAVFEGTIRDKARSAVRTEIQHRLDPLPPELRDALDVGKQLEEILGALHPRPAGVALTGVEIRADGIVVPGTVGLAPSRPVVVKRVGRNGFVDALESWIPGGTIERFVWDGRVEEHRFVTERPGAVYEGMRCLTVQGTRVTHGGGLVPVTGEDCPVLVADLPHPPRLPTPPLPCRRPLLPLLTSTPDGRVEVVGHYDPWGSGLAPSAGPTNLLLHFADGSWVEAAKGLAEALAATRKRDAAIVVIGVLGAGGLAEAAGATLDADTTLLLTEDPSGNWSRAFGVSNLPATVLVGPDGTVRWTTDALDSAKLGRALDKQLESGGEVSWRALRPAVAASDQAPDAPLPLGEGTELALRRLRGKAVVLSFWTSCSEPSIEQLRQLRAALETGREDQVHVVGIGDGENSEQVAKLAEREQFPFPLVADPERSIAHRYGVSSWPSTIQVGGDGRVVAVDVGLLPGLSPCDRVRHPPASAASSGTGHVGSGGHGRG